MAVLHCSVVTVKMPNMFSNEDYADMHFEYSSAVKVEEMLW